MSGLGEWRDASKHVAPDGVEVLATDGECWFIAFHTTEWCDVATDEPIDSVVTHWMFLPEIPEV